MFLDLCDKDFFRTLVRRGEWKENNYWIKNIFKSQVVFLGWIMDDFCGF